MCCLVQGLLLWLDSVVFLMFFFFLMVIKFRFYYMLYLYLYHEGGFFNNY